jgi:hypothetical protein
LISDSLKANNITGIDLSKIYYHENVRFDLNYDQCVGFDFEALKKSPIINMYIDENIRIKQNTIFYFDGIQIASIRASMLEQGSQTEYRIAYNIENIKNILASKQDTSKVRLKKKKVYSARDSSTYSTIYFDLAYRVNNDSIEYFVKNNTRLGDKGDEDLINTLAVRQAKYKYSERNKTVNERPNGNYTVLKNLLDSMNQMPLLKNPVLFEQFKAKSELLKKERVINEYICIPYLRIKSGSEKATSIKDFRKLINNVEIVQYHIVFRIRDTLFVRMHFDKSDSLISECYYISRDIPSLFNNDFLTLDKKLLRGNFILCDQKDYCSENLYLKNDKELYIYNDKSFFDLEHYVENVYMEKNFLKYFNP